jgi:signal transduction histidine kinase
MTDRSATNIAGHCAHGGICRFSLERLSRLAAATVVLIGTAALSGWMLDIAALHSILPGLPPMAPGSALGVALAGTALYLLQPQGMSPRRRRAGQALALLVLLPGLVTAVTYLLQLPALGVDRLLFPLLTPESDGVRQSPHSAAAFILTGLALFLLGERRQRLIYSVQWIAVLLLAMSIVVLFGYLFGLTVFYSFNADIAMALPTSLSFTILANGILLARPEQGVMGFITSDTAGGVLMRRLLPSVILATMAINWLLMTSEKSLGITEAFEHSMHAVMTTLLITLIIVVIAVSLNREEKLRRSAEEGSRQYQADLAHLVRLVTMGEMVATIAHELKQPLTAINLYAANGQAMLNTGQPPLDELNNYLGEIQSQSMRAAEIIRRTREFARNQKPQTSPVQLNGLIAEVTDFLKVEARDSCIGIELDLAPRLPAIEADALQLKQVLLNIVHNAIECLQSGDSADKRVTIRTRVTERDGIRVDISDTGPGMDADTLARIFESFFTTKGHAGMGMGLSISRSIIEAHGGQLWATSTPGQGATFSLTLPRG